MRFYLTAFHKVAHLLWLFIIAGGVESNQNVSSAFEVLGYSPVCVASALASCQRDENLNCTADLTKTELQSLLQEVKCEKMEVINCSSLVDSSVYLKKILLQLDSHEKERDSSGIQAHFNTLSNSCAEIQELKASTEREHSEIKEIKSLLQEIMQRLEKSEKITETLENYLNILTKSRAEILELSSRQAKSLDLNITLHKERKDLSPKEVPKRPKNCQEVFDFVNKSSGVRTIHPFRECQEHSVTVYCDQTTDGGGWTVFQNRDALPKRENFYRGWNDYMMGFGDVNGEFWLGLDNLHALVAPTPVELRVDLEDYDGENRWAKYGIFCIGDAYSLYKLQIGNYSGDAGDSLSYKHNRMEFSTKDRDNDISGTNCAQISRGAWWYESCHTSNLNGYQHAAKHSTMGDGINWMGFRGPFYSLKKASLKVRPISK